MASNKLPVVFLVFHADAAILNFFEFYICYHVQNVFREKYILNLVWYIV